MDSKSPDDILFPDNSHRIISFVFRVPVQVPFGQMGTIGVQMEGLGPSDWEGLLSVTPVEGVPPAPHLRNAREPFVSLRFFHANRKTSGDPLYPINEVAKLIYGSSVAPEAPPDRSPDLEPDYDTVIEGITQGFISDREATAPNITAACFERIVTVVNRLLVATGVFFRDPAFSFVSPRSLDPFVVAATRPLEAPPFDRGPILYLLNTNIRLRRPPMTLEQQERVMRNFQVLSLGHPFMNGLRLELAARDAHRRGDNADALIAIVAAGEYVLNTIVRCLIAEEGTPALFEQILATKESLALRVNSEYASRLGGRWSTRDPATVPAAWWRDAQAPRGKTVHGGYWPSHGEVDLALAAGKALDDFIDERLVDRLSKYPRTALTRLGTARLRKMGVGARRLERLGRQVGPSLPDFWKLVGTPVDVRRPD